MLEAIIAAVVTGGLGITLTFLFTRNREVSSMAHQVIASTNTYFNVIETLKKVAFIQGQRIDQWERWGRELYETIEENCPGLDLPEMPELHLDLRPYWSEIDSAIEDMTKSNRKRANKLPHYSHIGSTIGVEDEK